jgi:hypothetical protein
MTESRTRRARSGNDGAPHDGRGMANVKDHSRQSTPESPPEREQETRIYNRWIYLPVAVGTGSRPGRLHTGTRRQHRTIVVVEADMTWSQSKPTTAINRQLVDDTGDDPLPS